MIGSSPGTRAPLGDIVSIIVTSYQVKLTIAIGCTPLIYGGAHSGRWLKIEPDQVGPRN